MIALRKIIMNMTLFFKLKEAIVHSKKIIIQETTMLTTNKNPNLIIISTSVATLMIKRMNKYIIIIILINFLFKHLIKQHNLIKIIIKEI